MPDISPVFRFGPCSDGAFHLQGELSGQFTLGEKGAHLLPDHQAARGRMTSATDPLDPVCDVKQSRCSRTTC